MKFFTTLTVWHWLSLACILSALDVLVGANFMLMLLGGSALLVSIVVAIYANLAIEHQLLLFAIIGIFAFVFWYKVLNKHAAPLDLTLNNRTQGYIGRVFEVEEAIVNGRGKIKIGDTLWLATAKHDIPVGVKIKVTGSDGVVLEVHQV